MVHDCTCYDTNPPNVSVILMLRISFFTNENHNSMTKIACAQCILENPCTSGFHITTIIDYCQEKGAKRDDSIMIGDDVGSGARKDGDKCFHPSWTPTH